MGPIVDQTRNLRVVVARSRVVLFDDVCKLHNMVLETCSRTTAVILRGSIIVVSCYRSSRTTSMEDPTPRNILECKSLEVDQCSEEKKRWSSRLMGHQFQKRNLPTGTRMLFLRPEVGVFHRPIRNGLVTRQNCSPVRPIFFAHPVQLEILDFYLNKS